MSYVIASLFSFRSCFSLDRPNYVRYIFPLFLICKSKGWRVGTRIKDSPMNMQNFLIKKHFENDLKRRSNNDGSGTFFLRTPEGIGDSPDGGCQEHMHKTHSTFNRIS